MHPRLRPGQSLMEVLLAVAIFIISVATVGFLFIDASQTSRRGSDGAKARQFAVEGIEATRAIRDINFSNVTTGTKGLAIVGGQWTFSGTSDTQDGFTRTLTISAPDADTRYVTSTVTWTTGTQTATTTEFTILTNWNKFVSSGTWSAPAVTATTTIPGSIPALAVDVDSVRRLLYVTTPQSATGPEFWIYDITSPTNPVVRGSLEIGKDCLLVVASGTRAYVSANTNPAEVKIIDTTSSTAPFIAGSIKLNSNQNINGIALDGNNVHLVRDRAGNNNSYQIWDATIAASPVNLGGMYLGGGGGDIALNTASKWAFIASQVNAQELQDVNYSNPGSMGVGGSVNLPGIEDMKAIAVSGTQAYGGSSNRATAGEFFTFNITTPTAPTSLGSLEIGANINRLRVRPTIDSVTSAQNNLVFAATASSGHQFMVFNVTTSSAPSIFGFMALPGIGTGIAMTTSTAYVTTDNPGAGLMIITQ